MGDESQRRERLKREDEAARQRGETTRPDEIAADHGPAESLDGSTAQSIGDALDHELPREVPPVSDSDHGLDLAGGRLAPGKMDKGGGMAPIDPPAPHAPPPSPPEVPLIGEFAPGRPSRKVDLSGIKLDKPPEVEPSIVDSVDDPRTSLRQMFGGFEGGRTYERMPAAQQNLFLRVVGSGIALAGLLLLIWAFTGGRIPPEAAATLPVITFAPTTAPATVTPAPTVARAVTPIAAGPIVATVSGTTTSYTVEAAQGDGLKYQWAHSASCGSHLGETTANYTWDHPTPPCPAGSFQTSFITVQITDASGLALVRQYPTLGSRAGRGTVPDGGGVFTPQPTVALATTVVRTTAPSTAAAAQTAIATYATTASTKSDGGDVNYPLAGGGAVLVVGGLAVAIGGGRKRSTDIPMLHEDDRRY